jgi:arsenate reductase-like glutaredoxin family protein
MRAADDIGDGCGSRAGRLSVGAAATILQRPDSLASLRCVMQPQVLGHPKSRVTRKAQRFFAERGVAVTFNDLRKRAPTPGELRKWVEKFGVDGVLDRESAAYREAGLAYLAAGVDTWLDQFAAQPLLLRLPLVRCGRELAVGDDPQAWGRFVDLTRSR